MTDRKTLSLRELMDGGYLQEVNRRFFHPLGLALQVICENDGTPVELNFWDGRNDLEGIRFSTDEIALVDMRTKAAAVSEEWRRRSAVREHGVGYVIQPLEPGSATVDSSGE